jgi:hypothetical protein
MRIVLVACFLDEERHLPALLESIAAQSRPPDSLLLVDDGSTDGSPAVAEAFAQEHEYAIALRRPVREAGADRLADANELRAFAWALETLDAPWDVAGKLDADLRLKPTTLAALESRFAAEPRLGIAGPPLRSIDDVAYHTRTEHVEGATKFYRRECLDEIGPLPPILGWDTIDEIRARMRGWSTDGAVGEPVLHLRPMGAHDGMARAYRRWGACAYGYGEHPLHVLLIALRRMREHPRVVGGASYFAGWALAGVRRAPRAEPELRAYAQRDQLRRIGARLRG